MKAPINKSPLSSKSQDSKTRNALARPFAYRFFEEPFSLFDERILDENVFGLWQPRLDLSETSKQLKIQMDVPGVDPENIKVEVDKHSLTISGKAEKSTEEEGETWYRSERQSGSFCRSIQLGSNLDVEAIKASCKNGTLKIIIPKLIQENRRTIPIEK